MTVNCELVLPVRAIVKTPGERMDARGVVAVTVTVGGGAAFVTVIVCLALLLRPAQVTLSVAV